MPCCLYRGAAARLRDPADDAHHRWGATTYAVVGLELSPWSPWAGTFLQAASGFGIVLIWRAIVGPSSLTWVATTPNNTIVEYANAGVMLWTRLTWGRSLWVPPGWCFALYGFDVAASWVLVPWPLDSAKYALCAEDMTAVRRDWKSFQDALRSGDLPRSFEVYGCDIGG